MNEAKKVLATEATALVHGRAAAEPAAETARKTFEEGTLADTLPTVEVPRAELDKGLGVLTAFAEKTGLVASNGEARRQIKSGGLKVNDQPVTDENSNRWLLCSLERRGGIIVWVGGGWGGVD